MSLKLGDKAESDLQTALEYTSVRNIRTRILATMGGNRETNLQDDKAALEAYRMNYESVDTIGAADEFRSVQGAARILKRQGKYDESLAALHRARIEKLKGYWRHALQLSLGETLTAAGQKEQARKVYQEILQDDSASDRLQREAKEQIERLN